MNISRDAIDTYNPIPTIRVERPKNTIIRLNYYRLLEEFSGIWDSHLFLLGGQFILVPGSERYLVQKSLGSVCDYFMDNSWVSAIPVSPPTSSLPVVKELFAHLV